MFKGLRHLDGIGRAGLDAEIAHGAELQVVNQLVDGFFLFSFRREVKLGDHFDGAIGTGKLTGRTPCTAVFVLFIVRHHYFTTESFGENQRLFVVRVLLRDDLLVMREIICSSSHAFQQRTNRTENLIEVSL